MMAAIVVVSDFAIVCWLERASLVVVLIIVDLMVIIRAKYSWFQPAVFIDTISNKINLEKLKDQIGWG